MPLEPGEDWRRGVVVDTPAPASPPTFELAPDTVSSTPLWPVQEILDGLFFVISTVLGLATSALFLIFGRSLYAAMGGRGPSTR